MWAVIGQKSDIRVEGVTISHLVIRNGIEIELTIGETVSSEFRGEKCIWGN